MFKNMLKRSWLSIRRKLGRTVILTLIFLMMATLVLSAITVKSAVEAQMDYAKSTLGGTVSLQADMDAIRESQRTEMEAGGDRREVFKKMVRPSVEVETANKIAGYVDYVRDYSYEISTGAGVVDLETVETTGGMGMRPGGFGGPGGFDGGPGGEEESTADITISGVSAYAYVEGAKDGTVEIKEGTYFDEASDGGVLVSYELAKLNDLGVGDTFKLKRTSDESEVELNVVGIYDTSGGFANANKMYMNVETAAKFLSDEDYNEGNYTVNNVNFYMNNSERADEFVEKINADFPEFAENNLKVAVDTSEYDAMAGSIEGVGSFATVILVVVIIAAVIIVSLIVTINVKDRRYEMGVLLSLGATKKNVIGQIAIELLIVGTIGFAVASVIGSFTAKMMGDGIVASQSAASEQQMERNFGRPGAQMGGRPSGSGNGSMPPSMPTGAGGEMPMGAGSGQGGKGPGLQSKAVELDINAKPVDFLLLFVTGYVVIIVALAIPSLMVLRYQPKEILMGKE